MNNLKKVLAIVITYNAENWLHTCLDSLRKSKFPVDVAVVDNYSSDDTLAIIERNYLDVVTYLHVSNTNLGFGKAHNVVFNQYYISKYDYILLLNQDAEIGAITIKQLIDVFDEMPELGVVSPMQYYSKGQLDIMFERYYSSFLIEDNYKNNHNIRTVSFVNAAIWLIRSEVLLKVGFFNPLFDHYGEDNNYVHRVIKLDYQIGIVKNAIGFHYRPQGLSALVKKSRPKQFYTQQLVKLLNPLHPTIMVYVKFMFNLAREAFVYLWRLQFYNIIELNRVLWRVLRSTTVILKYRNSVNISSN